MFYAHSAKQEIGVAAQPYAEHITNVHRFACENAIGAGPLKFSELFQDAVRLAAEFHDLGKLDPLNQAVLNGQAKSQRSLPVNHVDAGVAHLWNQQGQPATSLAALLIYSHHRGLPDVALALLNLFRDIDLKTKVGKTKDWTDQHLASYIASHRTELSKDLVNTKLKYQGASNDRLLARMALSCLVDADHLDTALNYQNEQPINTIDLRANERLHAIDQYIDSLASSSDNTDRNRLRASVYSTCRFAEINRGIVSCDSPVGSGKTTAVMAHLLNAAVKHGMRRVFVVLPFTNIITQSVDVYRKSIVLAGEDPNQIVGAHHHRAEFEDVDSRHLTYRWQAPVIVTTAVQFFETLAAARTGALRKLHQLANSVIFIDESHASLPTQLWPVAWKWLIGLRDDWNCHFVLGSGSLSEFWRLPDICTPTERVESLISAEPAEASLQFELNRIRFRRHVKPLSLEMLIDWVIAKHGPRLLIVNTVQSAAFIAQALNDIGSSVEHLSTSLTPWHRKVSLDRVKARLYDNTDQDWTLVATSCVEAGVDISFAVGFRERCSLNSLLQTSGRVNRNNELRRAEVWDFQLIHDHRLRPHPSFEDTAAVLGELFDEDRVSPEFCTEAMRREINRAGMKSVSHQLVAAEQKREYDKVQKLFRVIDSSTDCAIVDQSIVDRLRAREQVSFRDIQDSSVQIYTNRRDELALEPIVEFPGLFKWTLDYNPFVGYMAGVIPNAEFLRNGGCVI